MILLLKGFIIGLAKIIPGVSGALLAISLDVYDKGIEAITHFFNDMKKYVRFLFPLGVGVILAIILGSNMVMFFLRHFYVVTMLFFIGLIVGGVKGVYQKIDRTRIGYVIFLVSFFVILIISISNASGSYVIQNNVIDIVVYLISGVIDAIGTVIPGVSSTALLMVFGSYDIIMSALGNVDLFVLTYYGIGMIISIVFISILMNYLFSHYEKKTFSFILGVTMSSILLLVMKVIGCISNIKELIIGIVLLVLGIFISRKLDR